MGDLVEVVLYGVLPSLAAALLLAGAFGTRFVGLAAGIGLLAAYALLRRLPDTAFVSVGHRASLLGYHDDVLRLEGREGAWRVVSAEAYGKETTALEEA